MVRPGIPAASTTGSGSRSGPVRTVAAARRATVTAKMMATAPITSLSEPGIGLESVGAGPVEGSAVGAWPGAAWLAVKVKLPLMGCPSAEVTRHSTS